MTDWQTISSAPKDGSEVILKLSQWVHPNRSSPEVKEIERRVIGQWVPNKSNPETGGNWAMRDLNHGTYTLVDVHWLATHWMPLPPPPKEGE